MKDECPHGNAWGLCSICMPVDTDAARIEPENLDPERVKRLCEQYAEMSRLWSDQTENPDREREELIARVKRLRKQFTAASRSVATERVEKKKVQARVSALQAEVVRLRAELTKARRDYDRLLDHNARACVRAEQAEDQRDAAKRESERLRKSVADLEQRPIVLRGDEIRDLAICAGFCVSLSESSWKDEYVIEACPAGGISEVGRPDPGWRTRSRWIAYHVEYPEEGATHLGETTEVLSDD